MTVARPLFAFVVFAAGGVWISGQVRTVAPPAAVYSAVQADAGRRLFLMQCAGCHAVDLGGKADAPALSGDEFVTTWRTRTTANLVEFIRSTMPPEGPSLVPEDTVDIVAFILQENGAPSGVTRLDAASTTVIGSVVNGRRSTSPSLEALLARSRSSVPHSGQ